MKYITKEQEWWNWIDRIFELPKKYCLEPEEIQILDKLETAMKKVIKEHYEKANPQTSV